VLNRLGELQKARGESDPEAFCRRFWAVLRALFVADPADADRLTWAPCHLPNERAFAKPYADFVLPSIQQLDLSAEHLSTVSTPVLAIHGRKDRSSPYGGGRDWVGRLPNARLLTMAHAAHVPWIEEPDRFYAALETFLDGAWPPDAESVRSLDA